MKSLVKYLAGIFIILVASYSCSDTKYSMGDLTAPTDLTINAEIAGASDASPAGDGSGDVTFTVTAKNAVSYKIDYDANTGLDLVYIPSGVVTKKYTNLGVNTYLVTAVAYGRGGTSTTLTKQITVRSDFTVNPQIANDLTGGSSKTWVVDKSVPGHFGVGPWSPSSVTPEWWSAGVNEKVACCNCFYTTQFTFAVDAASKTYSLQVDPQDGSIFTKTGSLTTLPGISASGDEGCYAYSGGMSAMSFAPSSSGIAASATTGTSILLAGNTTFIGYGAVQKEYEILSIDESHLYLRVQGTETGNAWYIKLIPVQ
jgi:hypothetical protein